MLAVKRRRMRARDAPPRRFPGRSTERVSSAPSAGVRIRGLIGFRCFRRRGHQLPLCCRLSFGMERRTRTTKNSCVRERWAHSGPRRAGLDSDSCRRQPTEITCIYRCRETRRQDARSPARAALRGRHSRPTKVRGQAQMSSDRLAVGQDKDVFAEAGRMGCLRGPRSRYLDASYPGAQCIANSSNKALPSTLESHG